MILCGEGVSWIHQCHITIVPFFFVINGVAFISIRQKISIFYPSLPYNNFVIFPYYFQVYIEGLLAYDCPRVLPGDRLGIYLEKTPGSVAYTFEPSNPLTLGFTNTNLSHPTQPGDNVMFESLTFPYVFSIAAFIDSGNV